jgi:curli production assembly/transport component CsgE
MDLRKFQVAVLLAACAGAQAAPGQCTVADAQVGGLVTNQAITPAGQDFFQAFTALWQDNALHERYNIAVREWPSAKSGNAIQIDYGSRIVFRAHLPAGRGAARELGESAVELAYDNIAAAEVECLLFAGGDLAAEEF